MDDLEKRWEARRAWAWEQADRLEKPFELQPGYDRHGNRKGMVGEAWPGVTFRRMNSYLGIVSGVEMAHLMMPLEGRRGSDPRQTSRIDPSQWLLVIPLVSDERYWHEVVDAAGRQFWERNGCPPAPAADDSQQS